MTMPMPLMTICIFSGMGMRRGDRLFPFVVLPVLFRQASAAQSTRAIYC
jgi:hypothetical protein